MRINGSSCVVYPSPPFCRMAYLSHYAEDFVILGSEYQKMVQ